MTDKRKVSTDALETLGTIIGPDEKRDAIHLAVIPIQAKEQLKPGEHVDGTGIGSPPYALGAVGIVDPFLKELVNPGQWFWLVLYPRQITSLRHVWTHPAFPEEHVLTINDNAFKEGGKLDEKEKSMKWMKEYAANLGYGPRESEWDDHPGYDVDFVLHAAKHWIKDAESTTIHGENDEVPEEFWEHYQNITGEKVHWASREGFFRCTC